MSASIAFSMESQEEDEWCWAASAVSAAAYFGSTQWSQCLLVNNQFAQITCCADGSGDACNKPWFLDRALTAAGCHFTYQANRIALADIVSSLMQNVVIEVRIGWTDGHGNFDGSGHFVAITAADPTSTVVHIADPWYPSSDIRYDDFASRYQTVGVWTDTFLIDRLLIPASEVGEPAAPSRAVFPLALKKAKMQHQTMNEKIPLYTLALDKAVEPRPLSAMSQTGTHTFTDEGFAKQASVVGATVSIQPDHRAIPQANATRQIVATLKDARILQIPGLLVTAVVGSKPGGVTAIKPIGRIPSFLEDRLYSRPDFEAVIQKQAARKIRLLKDMHDGGETAEEGQNLSSEAEDARAQEGDSNNEYNAGA